MTRVLVTSTDAAWLEGMRLDLMDEAIEAICLCAPSPAQISQAVQAAQPADPFAGAVISAQAVPGQHEAVAILDAANLVHSLLRLDHAFPILVWSPTRSDQLASNIAHKRTVMLASDSAAAIAAALATTPTCGVPQWAAVELEIGAAEICVATAIEGSGKKEVYRRAWTGRPKLQDLAAEFRDWPLWQKPSGEAPRYTDRWLQTFERVGRDLGDEFLTRRLTNEISSCLEKVKKMEAVHFRFNLISDGTGLDHPLVHVPFELIYDRAKQNFVRTLAPVARRICLRPDERAAAAPLSAVTQQSLTGTVLYVRADAHGGCESPNLRFGGKPELHLARLTSLDAEWTALQDARKEKDNAPFELPLKPSPDTAATLRQWLAPEAPPADRPTRWQVVHFGGHSVRADDGTVHLVLPGASVGQLRLLAVDEFARWAEKAGARLVILSSCESSSPSAVFRFAQWGVPAAVGFRWEVADKHAAAFTGSLHLKLATGVPLARAFHGAVSELRTSFADCPTFASPMLAVQEDHWTA